VSWERLNIQNAVIYLRERIAAGAIDARTKMVYEGLLEVLDPKRRTLRLQREAHEAAKSSVPVTAARERRALIDRRAQGDRRRMNLGPPDGVERRRGSDRRSGVDRRNR
jgi:hypothetical protein